MQFRASAPANLTQEGSTYYADWSVAVGNFGHTDAEVEGWVASALNDPNGLAATGIQPRHVATGSAKVIFEVVETIPGETGIIGQAEWNLSPVVVLLEEAWFGFKDLPNHEAIHAFLLAAHSAEGSNSIMEPLDEPGDEGLSPIDIQEIQAWLAGDFSGTAYWFPGDLHFYITRWIVPAGSKCRLVATVMKPAPVVMRAVCAATHDEMILGNHQPFGLGIAAGQEGFLASEWVDAPAGEFYVGIIVEGGSVDDFQDFTVGLADVQIAAPTATGGGTPIGN